MMTCKCNAVMQKFKPSRMCCGTKTTADNNCFIFLQALALLYEKYCTLHGRIKGTKCALFSIKCKGAVSKISNYEVCFVIAFVPQHIPEGDNCISALRLDT